MKVVDPHRPVHRTKIFTREISPLHLTTLGGSLEVRGAQSRVPKSVITPRRCHAPGIPFANCTYRLNHESLVRPNNSIPFQSSAPHTTAQITNTTGPIADGPCRVQFSDLPASKNAPGLAPPCDPPALISNLNTVDPSYSEKFFF